jgi:hypothetical protein
MSDEKVEEKPVENKEEEKKEEVKLEEKKEEVAKVEEPPKKKSEMNLAEIVVDYLGLEKKEVELSPKLQKMMAKLPAIEKIHLENVEKFFNKIIEDKEINVKDMPSIVGLMQELFFIYDDLRMNASATDIGKVFNVLIRVMVMYKLEESDKLTQEEKDAILNTLDTCIGLCKQMIDLKETKKAMKRWLWTPCR